MAIATAVMMPFGLVREASCGHLLAIIIICWHPPPRSGPRNLTDTFTPRRRISIFFGFGFIFSTGSAVHIEIFHFRHFFGFFLSFFFSFCLFLGLFSATTTKYFQCLSLQLSLALCVLLVSHFIFIYFFI